MWSRRIGPPPRAGWKAYREWLSTQDLAEDVKLCVEALKAMRNLAEHQADVLEQRLLAMTRSEDCRPIVAALCTQRGLRYAPLHGVPVRHHEHGRARQCLPRGVAMRAGVRRFYELHRQRMTPGQQQEFRDVARRWWGVDEHGRVIDAPDLVVRPWLA